MKQRCVLNSVVRAEQIARDLNHENMSCNSSGFERFYHREVDRFEKTSTQLVKPDRRESGPTALRAGPDYQLLCELVQLKRSGSVNLELQ
ncbi:hypothetical protein F511_25736 [Dorcoceras hygrometricum]|uniref:Uncharacterized protein n=1 Tax=Dorcoceras hygrometricum TaxID=472368 RepID=A0A2Z7AI90_9LAMI|nr:hypothetical protein F511_25736 [Dorcoceras hygrometricum]